MTTSETWERVAENLPAHIADAIEENVADLGIELESDEFWAECIRQAQEA